MSMGDNEFRFWLTTAIIVFAIIWGVIALIIAQFAHMRLYRDMGVGRWAGVRYLLCSFFLTPITALVMLQIEVTTAAANRRTPAPDMGAGTIKLAGQ